MAPRPHQEKGRKRIKDARRVGRGVEGRKENKVAKKKVAEREREVGREKEREEEKREEGGKGRRR